MSSTTAFLCAACGLQHAPSEGPPTACAICLDDRQYVPPAGQAWTTLDDLRRTHRNVLTPLEPGLTGIRTAPGFAIHHNAFLLETGEGNVLWDCVALIDDDTVAALRA